MRRIKSAAASARRTISAAFGRATTPSAIRTGVFVSGVALMAGAVALVYVPAGLFLAGAFASVFSFLAHVGPARTAAKAAE